MARTAKRAEDLIEDDPDMRDALRVVLDRAEDGRVAWDDVSGALTSGQWGRLIERGVLEKTDGDGCAVDTEEVAAALGEDEEPATTTSTSTSTGSDEDDEDSSWSTYDKLAALGALGLFAGYSVGEVRNAIAGVLDALLGPLDVALPFYAVILVLALFTGLYSTILQDNLMNTERMGEYQKRLQEIQEREKEARERDDEEALDRIQEEKMEAMGDNLGMFKEQFRPMVWIMLLTIPVFLWMYWKILPGGGGIVGAEPTALTFPLVGELEEGWTASVIGPIQAWIVWYFLCSMGFTQIIRKALHIQTTPSG